MRTRFTSEERLALLLSVLGADAEKAALAKINPTRAVYVRKLIEDFQVDPPGQEDVDAITEEFSRFFGFALASIKPIIEEQKSTPTASKKTGGDSSKAKEAVDEIVNFPLHEETEDCNFDLNQLDAYQIADALKEDHPRTIALVLDRLGTDTGAKVINFLSDETRSAVVLQFCQESHLTAELETQLLRATFRKANQVRTKKLVVDRTDNLAQLMRQLPKATRSSLLNSLTEFDQDMVESMKSKLYLFSDLTRLDDRDVQKLIGEIDSDSMITALVNCDEEIAQKLLTNLSKRARGAIESELEYQSNVAAEDIELARTEIAMVIARLDEAGEISLEAPN